VVLPSAGIPPRVPDDPLADTAVPDGSATPLPATGSGPVAAGSGAPIAAGSAASPGEADTTPADADTAPAAAEGPALAPGQLLGRYRIESRLGMGGMGIVYAARDTALDRRVAVKLLRRGATAARSRLQREGKALARLRHPNVVAVHDIGTHDGEVFIAMELVDGTTLKRWLERPRDRGEILAVLTAAGRGLAAAHAAGLVHRDFKPENVLISSDGRVVVSDFGLAHVDDESADLDALAETAPGTSPGARLTRTGSVMGTPAYMSPEQFAGSGVGARSDQFSFCVVAFEALYRSHPFAAADPTLSYERLSERVRGGEVIDPPGDAGVPPRLRRALMRGLSVDPERRFATIDDLLAALAHRRRRAPLLAGAVVVCAGAAAVVVWPRSSKPAPLVAPPPACPALARIESLWNPAARAAYADRVDAPARAQDLPWFDGFATRWTGLRRDACAEEAAGPPTPALAGRIACLDAAVGTFEVAVRRSRTDAWPALASLDRCARGDLAAPSLKPIGGRISEEDGFALSPDGQRLASASGDRLYLSSVDGHGERTLPLPGAPHLLGWLAGGDQLVIEDRDGVAALDPATGARRPLVSGMRNAAVSPDGRWLACSHDTVLELRSLAEPDRPPRVIGEATRAAAEVAWSPDGALLAAHLRDKIDAKYFTDRIRVYVMATGETSDVDYRMLTTGLTLAWLPGHRLVVNGEHDQPYREGLWLLGYDDHGRPLEPPELRIAAIDRTLYDTLGGGGDRLLVRRTDMDRQLVRLVDRPRSLPGRLGDWLPRAVDDADRRLLVLRLDGAWGWLDLATESVTSIDLPAGSPRATMRGGKLVFLRARPGGWDLVERDEQGADTAVYGFAAPADDPPPAVSCAAAAPGFCAVITRNQDGGKLIVIGPDGTATTRPLDTREWDGFEPSPDGRRLVVVRADGPDVWIHDLRSLAARRWSVLPRCGANNAHWTRDGRAVIADLDCGEKRLVRMDGSTSEVLRRSPDQIQSYAVGPGGAIYAGILHWDMTLLLAEGM